MDTIFIGKISLGHISVKNVGGVTVVFLSTLFDGGLYVQSFMKIISTVLEWTGFSKEKFQRGMIP